MIFVRKALSLYFLRALNKRLLFIGCFAIMVFCRAEAAELGKIKMKSGVGEPFLAEIEVQAKKDFFFPFIFFVLTSKGFIDIVFDLLTFFFIFSDVYLFIKKQINPQFMP